MQQHAAAKRAYPDSIIFFRLGDFYEMFGEDAIVASKLLDLTLTSRNRGKPDEIPMAGVPHHAAHSYIAKLLLLGHKVALCEQMTDPKLTKGIVPREVVRVITPGTWTDESSLDSAENHYLCAIVLDETGGQANRPCVGVALVDLTTAELRATELTDLSAVFAEVSRSRPREILVSGPGATEVGTNLRASFPSVAVRQGEFEPSIETSVVDLSQLGILARQAAERALGFARACLRGRPLPIYRVAAWSPAGVLELDRAAQLHLELVESNSGDPTTTLLYAINRTLTRGGGRLLRARLLGPLSDLQEINARLDEVSALFEADRLRKELRAALEDSTDLERLIVRVAYAEASPKDLGNIRRGLGAAQRVADILEPHTEVGLRLRLPERLDTVRDILDVLEGALVERPPAFAKEGAIFRSGFDAELDRYDALRLRGSEGMTGLEERLRQETGITNLRIRYTRVFGWYVEVGRAHSARVPPVWKRKQTVASGERYTFEELDGLASEIEEAEERFRARELDLFADLVRIVAGAATRIHALAHTLAALDVAQSSAELAREHDYTRPVVDASYVLDLKDARHPVVERVVGRAQFVQNDVALDALGVHLWLITGPNMAGKSTFLRQTALVVILAQMGCFVPARAARVGLFDRILSRVGAGDNLAGGESTFMVEMRETAQILRSASRRSLVIVDEIGRGTSTFDGLSIARAVAEHLDEAIGCRSLFATHYHELTSLGDERARVANYSVAAEEVADKIVFYHRVVAGAASRSYGVSVAELAGLPDSVLTRARTLLLEFERTRPSVEEGGVRQGGPLPSEQSVRMEELLDAILQADLDRMTGLDALNFVQSLQDKLRTEGRRRA